MVTHRIRELREARGLSQARLATAIGRTKSVISRIEDGTTRLDLDVATNIAKELGISLAEMLNIEQSDPGRVTGFSEDLSPFSPPADDWRAPLQRDSRYLHTVESDVLDAMGIAKGDVVVVDISAEAVRGIQPLQVAQVRWHPVEDFARPLTLLRQFVPPRLLITNSQAANQRMIDLISDDAHIVGVVVDVLKRMPGMQARS